MAHPLSRGLEVLIAPGISAPRGLLARNLVKKNLITWDYSGDAVEAVRGVRQGTYALDHSSATTGWVDRPSSFSIDPATGIAIEMLMDLTSASNGDFGGVNDSAAVTSSYATLTHLFTANRRVYYTIRNATTVQLNPGSDSTRRMTHWVGTSRSNTNHELYEDAASAATSTTDCGTASSDFNSISYGCRVYDQTGDPNNASIPSDEVFKFAVYSRGLTDQDVQALYDDPWQMVEEYGRRTWFMPSAGGPTFTQAVAGSLTPSGALALQINFKAGVTGSATPSGALAKKISTSLTGSVTPSGALLKTIKTTLTGSIATAGSLLKKVATSLTGSTTPEGDLYVTWKQDVDGSSTPSGSLSSNLIVGGALKRLTAWMRRRRGSP